MLSMISIYLFMHLGDSFDEYLVKCQQNYERYVVRQKRAEGKKALKDYLLYGKSSPHLQVNLSTSLLSIELFLLFWGVGG